MKCGIYAIKCIITGKRYIGSSVSIEKRWTRHKWELKNNKHPNSHLQRAWNKYGELNFEFLIVEICAKDSLIDKERHYISQNNNGFNIRTDPVSLLGESNPFYGKKHTDETKRKISLAKKGTIPTNETRAKLRKSSVRKKISDRDVRDIRRMFSNGFSSIELSAKYSVARSYIYDLVNFKRRQHVG